MQTVVWWGLLLGGFYVISESTPGWLDGTNMNGAYETDWLKAIIGIAMLCSTAFVGRMFK